MSKIFQYKHVDVSIVGVLVKAEITLIYMLFITKFTNLNIFIFNENIGYHIIHDIGPLGGYLKMLSFEIRGAE